MSRRLRLEEERLKNIKNEEDEEEDKLKLQRERIYAPILWQRLSSGFRIQDLKENYYDEVLQIFKEHYIPFEVLCKNAEMIDDEESTECYLKQLLFQLKETQSIIAIQEETGAIAGILILRAINKYDFARVFSRIQLMQGEALKKCVNMKSTLNRKVDIYAKFNCETFLRYYAICVVPEFRKRGLGYQLMRCGLDVARSMHAPVTMGIFSNFKSQKLAKRLNMQVMHEISYVNWRDNTGEMVFDDPGAGNYTCALMAGEVPPAPPPEPPKPTAEQLAAKPVKLTRAEKKAAVAKKSK